MFFRCCKINGIDVYKEYTNKIQRERDNKKAEAVDRRLLRGHKINDKYAEKIYGVSSENPEIQAIISAIGDSKLINA